MSSSNLTKRLRRSAPFALSALVGVAALLVRPRRYVIAGTNALVTGGARGLGLEVARVLVSKGANVALVARDPDELARAVAELRTRNPRVSVIGVRSDLTDRTQIGTMLDAVRSELGEIDLVVNNAGTIQVGPLDAMTTDDFENAMRLHFEAPLHIILALRDGMRQRGGGRIANVSSIGGLVAVPHLLPYCASKFALVGLSQGLRAELARDRIVVSTIAPGLMRTGSPRNALFKGDHRREHAWFAISDSLPLLSMSSERAARRIVRAIERGEAHVTLGLPAKLAAFLNGIAPNMIARAMTIANHLLPSGSSTDARKGAESESSLARSFLTALSRRAALRNNET